MVLMIQDEGEKRRVGHRLSHEASHDALTSMTNRRKFDRRLAGVVADPELGATDQALLMIDLDRFKVVNDTGGHEAGDALLASLRPLLSRCLRKGDTRVRMGGDKFAVLLEHCTMSDDERVAEQVRAAIEACRFEWAGQLHGITATATGGGGRHP